jgi:Domain of unknown function (DUF6908)
MNNTGPAIQPALARDMRKLGAKATNIFNTLVDGLLVGHARKLDNAPGTFMAVSIDCLMGDRAPSRSGSLYAIAHRYEANGDLVPDPDVEFYVVDDVDAPGGKAVYPAAIDHGPLGYYRYIHFDSVSQPVRVAPRGQAELARFCDVWLRNIAFQQGLTGPEGR